MTCAGQLWHLGLGQIQRKVKTGPDMEVDVLDIGAGDGVCGMVVLLGGMLELLWCS
jgi:hypothetical protein